ncbi:MAG TPA: DUF1285 domain-containing protein [Hyphomicrobiaceae bacterium]|nr:DUF1285 domain-containing protein [Hyphomicrobiaceae bacterium]
MERWDPPCRGDIGLRIRSDGVWLCRESPIVRPALLRLFASTLRRDKMRSRATRWRAGSLSAVRVSPVQ